MNKVIRFNKLIGETPLEAIERLRLDNPEFRDEKITYAGRLDPLAEGELILLVGEAVHQKENYLKKDKEYIVDIVLGISTDTFDSLGLVAEEGSISGDYKEKIKKFLENNKGEVEQKYPPFSSKTINGVPMFELTKKGVDYKIPAHTVKLYEYKIKNFDLIGKRDLKKEIKIKNSLVRGDFRQVEIKERWNDYFEQTEYEEYPVITIKMKVSSGFYVRQFTDDLGNYLKCGAFTMGINRTKIFDI